MNWEVCGRKWLWLCCSICMAGWRENHEICESGWCSQQGVKQASPAYKCELLCHKWTCSVEWWIRNYK